MLCTVQSVLGDSSSTQVNVRAPAGAVISTPIANIGAGLFLLDETHNRVAHHIDPGTAKIEYIMPATDQIYTLLIFDKHDRYEDTIRFVNTVHVEAASDPHSPSQLEAQVEERCNTSALCVDLTAALGMSHRYTTAADAIATMRDVIIIIISDVEVEMTRTRERLS